MHNLERSGLKPVARRSTAEAVTSKIRDAIFDGSYQPGAQMREVQLAAQLGISRGPLREALHRLIQEGLLEHRRHRGVFVVRLDQDDVDDIYFVRETVELPAALRLARNPDPATFAALQELVDSMKGAARDQDWGRVVQLDAEFHQTVVASVGSERLARMFETVQAETRMCLGALRPAYRVDYDVPSEHRDLLRALRGGDEASLARLWTAHLREAAANLGASLAASSHDRS
jgi:DNA-binding GntR family transcriptional regulator